MDCIMSTIFFLHPCHFNISPTPHNRGNPIFKNRYPPTYIQPEQVVLLTYGSGYFKLIIHY